MGDVLPPEDNANTLLTFEQKMKENILAQEATAF